MISDVHLERGQPHQRAALANLSQLYVHDFADFMGPEQRIDLQEDGLFPPLPHIDEYWTDPARAVWFIRAGGRLAGFALVNRHSHSGLPVDYNVGEFFVARPYRRDQVGARAVAALVNAHPGRWEAAISARNVPAQAFWPRAVASARAAEIEVLEGDGEAWTGPILRFLIRG